LSAAFSAVAFSDRAKQSAAGRRRMSSLARSPCRVPLSRRRCSALSGCCFPKSADSAWPSPGCFRGFACREPAGCPGWRRARRSAPTPARPSPERRPACPAPKVCGPSKVCGSLRCPIGCALF